MEEAILRIRGEVTAELSLTFSDLCKLDAEYQIADVSQVVPNRSGAAVWLHGLLETAQVNEHARFLGLHSEHDDFHASIPLDQVKDRGLVIYQLDGQPLSREKGGPVRFFIPGHASCNTDEIDGCANVKFVDQIELTVERGFDNRSQDEDEHAKLHEK